MGAASAKAMYSRRAVHAGSWYSDDAPTLRRELQRYLDQATNNDNDDDSNNDTTTQGLLRSVMVPHAGYRYSGTTAAYSYKALQHALSQQPHVTTLVVLHPSHHVLLRNACAVSGASHLETPLGNLTVSDALRQEILRLSGKVTFTTMTASVDEDEHSGEMQYPYLYMAIQQRPIQVLPIMCGNLDTAHETWYGQALASILSRPEIITVVSTDFCHWGIRFGYQPTGSNQQIPIHEYIQQLDRRGMDLIQLQQPGAFAGYLKETRNTICGRHAIAVWLRALEASAVANTSSINIRMLKYAQSSAVTSLQDSSVSYVSAIAVQESA
jgi:MEMO1 family protein